MTTRGLRHLALRTLEDPNGYTVELYCD